MSRSAPAACRRRAIAAPRRRAPPVTSAVLPASDSAMVPPDSRVNFPHAGASPVHVVHWTERGIMERGVDAELRWCDRPATGELLAAAERIAVPAPYVSEIALLARAWMRTLAQSLERGAIFVIDYGFPAREY